MIYPESFEQKIGFNEIRSLLSAFCLSELGREEVGRMCFSTHADEINQWMEETREFRKIKESEEDFPLNNVFDVRASVSRIRLEGTHLETDELFELLRSLETIYLIVNFLSKGEEEKRSEDIIVKLSYPSLHQLTTDIKTFPLLVQRIKEIIDKYGQIRDTASPTLTTIRRELARIRGSISKTLHSILCSAQSEGVVEKDVMPTLRDGRLVIPVAPGMKRKIAGIVHDESATGRTVYVEPSEVVEANNKIRELENEERREIIRILVEFTKLVRPHADEILRSIDFLGRIEFINAKTELALKIEGTEFHVSAKTKVDWIQAVHPLLRLTLKKKHEKAESRGEELPASVIPLDIQLSNEQHILIISGPNAGGKSVCLKTVGLLQYMLQCGLSIPINPRSQVGVFQDIMIDIGDEQSIENDLSTYSSHLQNMKNMMRQANHRTLILIDEFGTGTEPQIGGAIAEAVLKQFWKKKAWAVITTHYQNLKHFSETHEGVVNGAMLYDRHNMRPLFQLAIGRPGSSFAIEIARKTGIPEEVIQDASEIVGSDYIQSDKYLQDIVRDKRYWENKRQAVHGKEKELERTIEQYEKDITELQKSRKEILQRAKTQAEELLKESNRRIENVIREIREQQAEKAATKKLRQALAEYEAGLLSDDGGNTSMNGGKQAKKGKNKENLRSRGLLNDADFQKQIEKIKQRKERHERHLKEKAEKNQNSIEALRQATQAAQATKKIDVNDAVRIKGLTTIGKVESVDGKSAVVIFGDMRSKMQLSRLELADTKAVEASQKTFKAYNYSRQTRETIDEHRNQFKHELDVRGLRTDEAILQVEHFLDDAILVGAGQVSILHGKGNGILRTMIRQYLKTIPNVTAFRDEHVQFGGAGITIVEL